MSGTLLPFPWLDLVLILALIALNGVMSMSSIARMQPANGRAAADHNVPVSGLADYGDPDRHPRLARLARQLAVADFSSVYLALALDHERALHP